MVRNGCWRDKLCEANGLEANETDGYDNWALAPRSGLATGFRSIPTKVSMSDAALRFIRFLIASNAPGPPNFAHWLHALVDADRPEELIQEPTKSVRCALRY
jgi:hypothetical protein